MKAILITLIVFCSSISLATKIDDDKAPGIAAVSQMFDLGPSVPNSGSYAFKLFSTYFEAEVMAHPTGRLILAVAEHVEGDPTQLFLLESNVSKVISAQLTNGTIYDGGIKMTVPVQVTIEFKFVSDDVLQTRTYTLQYSQYGVLEDVIADPY